MALPSVLSWYDDDVQLQINQQLCWQLQKKHKDRSRYLLCPKCLILKRLDVLRAGVLQLHPKTKDASLKSTPPLNELTSTAPSATLILSADILDDLISCASVSTRPRLLSKRGTGGSSGMRCFMSCGAAAVICNNRWLSVFPLI